MVLKSGGNDIHGSAWYYNRDSLFAANAWASNLVGAAKSNLSWNQFGGTFGGPIKKNKIFYFADYEGFRESYSYAVHRDRADGSRTPGRFLSHHLLRPAPRRRFRTTPYRRLCDDPVGAKMLALYPAANTPGTISSSGQTINNYAIQAPGTEHDQKGDGKVDYNISEKNVVLGALQLSAPGHFQRAASSPASPTAWAIRAASSIPTRAWARR